MSKYWIVSCNSLICKTWLETCIAINCLGVRSCKTIIAEYYPSRSLCANKILDNSYDELVNGNFYPICDNSDDLPVKACYSTVVLIVSQVKN